MKASTLWARRALVVVLAPAILLVAGEGLARLFYDPPPLQRVWDPFGYRIPHPNLIHTFRRGDGRQITVRWNELGMRGLSLAEPTAPDTRTVVFLGGSTTENYVLELADTFPELIGAGVSSRIGRRLRVLNAGMSAATTSTSLARLQHQVLDLEPSLIVVMHAINDLIGGFHSNFRADGRHLPRPPGVGTRPRSYLVNSLRLVRSRRRGPPPSWRGPELQRADYQDFAALRVFVRNLKSMAAIAAAHGVPILFLTQPSMYAQGLKDGNVDGFGMVRSLTGLGMTPPDVASLAAGMAAFNDVVHELPVGSGVHVFDLAAAMPADWGLFTDECHYTAAGNRAIAELLTPVIAEILATPAAEAASP